MQRDYDIFELFPDGSPMWRGRANGLPEVRLKLTEVATTTANECFAMHLSTREVVARVNVGGSRPKVAKRLVGQISYDHTLAMKRTDLLRARCYEVVSVIGNEAAKLVFDLSPSWNLFIVGDGAPREHREEMVAWLRAKFPGIPILALNPSTMPVLCGADYNFESHATELWLPLLSHALNRLPDSSSDSVSQPT